MFKLSNVLFKILASACTSILGPAPKPAETNGIPSASDWIRYGSISPPDAVLWYDLPCAHFSSVAPSRCYLWMDSIHHSFLKGCFGEWESHCLWHNVEDTARLAAWEKLGGFSTKRQVPKGGCRLDFISASVLFIFASLRHYQLLLHMDDPYCALVKWCHIMLLCFYHQTLLMRKKKNLTRFYLHSSVQFNFPQTLFGIKHLK